MAEEMRKEYELVVGKGLALRLVVSHVWNRRCSWEVTYPWYCFAYPNPNRSNYYFSVD